MGTIETHTEQRALLLNTKKYAEEWTEINKSSAEHIPHALYVDMVSLYKHLQSMYIRQPWLSPFSEFCGHLPFLAGLL